MMTSAVALRDASLSAALWLSLWVAYTTAQGLLPSPSTLMGASSTMQQLASQYSASQAWRRAYRAAPSGACSAANSASLCAGAGDDAAEASARLFLATSPAKYSSIDPSDTGGVRLVGAALTQGSCNTCVACSVAGAAETAAAAFTQTDVSAVSISAQALYFCPEGGGPALDCQSGWHLPLALQELRARGARLPSAACLPYNADLRWDDPGAYDEACRGRCSAPSAAVEGAQFSSRVLSTPWQAQQHILRYGAFVTRFDVYDDFKPFFNDFSNARAMYKPRTGAKFQMAHAVTVVGYDNDGKYWVAKNSWGPGWADDGFFRFAYDCCAVLSGASAEAYGVTFRPRATPAARVLPVAAASRKGCFAYQARRGDYLSRVAWLAGVPLDQFMLDNTAQVKDLDAPLAGVTLLLCNPAPGTTKAAGGDRGPLLVQPSTPVPALSRPSPPMLVPAWPRVQPPGPPPATTILEALQGNGLALFVRLAKVSGLTPAFSAPVTKATIFAPTDEAVTRLMSDMGMTSQQLFSDELLVDRIAAQHIVTRQVLAAAALVSGPLSMVRGSVTVEAGGGGITLKGPQNAAQVVKADIPAGASIVHVIDAVLLPNNVFTNLKDALSWSQITKAFLNLLSKDATLAKAISDPRTNITLLAPADTAVAEAAASGALQPVLSSPDATAKLLAYHAVSGARIFPSWDKNAEILPTLYTGHSISLQKVVTGKNGTIQLTADSAGAKPAKIVKFNIVAGNSMLHVINGVLIPAM